MAVLGILTLLAVALLLSTGVQAWASARAPSLWPAPGTRVDVGGYALHVHCIGEGSPPVVLEAGGGAFSLSWSRVQAAARDAGVRTCSIDRAGLGWSDPAPSPYRLDREVDALHRELDAIAGGESIVLVAHSYGAFFSMRYASRHPERVRALVLVDPNTVAFFDAHPEVMSRSASLARTLRIAGPLGIVRWVAAGQIRAAVPPELSAEADAIVGLGLTTKSLRAATDEAGTFAETLGVMRETVLPETLPLVLISRGLDDPGWTPAQEETWRQAHRDLVMNHPHARLVMAEKSRHTIPASEPELIVRVIANEVERARREGSLNEPSP